MKRFVFIFTLTMLFSLNVCAETYHGIDIDKVYSQSDWSSKDKIKEIIDDYKLLRHINKNLMIVQLKTMKYFFVMIMLLKKY